MEQLSSLLLLLFSSHLPLAVTDNALTNDRVAVIHHSETIPALKDLNPTTFMDSMSRLYDVMDLQKYELSFDAFKYGMTGYLSLLREGKLNNKGLLTIIDFTKSSNSKRFYTLDLINLAVKFHTYVSHGKNTGEVMAKSFSNTVHSNQSSLGLYVTGETYVGSKGYSLKLDGMEKGYNDKIRERAVVMHNAEYVSEHWIRKYGRLGRSQGCPALPNEIGKKVIDTIKNHTVIFAYYDDTAYLSSSPYLNPENLFAPIFASSQAGN
ncbi:MAG TPA: murein L,D-transpeptidase catalytic domain family protein [Chryseolinea sp.]|nr:murein L,D-transpeptidase catalytic domain family protein [Chryseolinea sp.]